MCAAMKDQLSRQMFEVVIQAAANGKIVARETMKVHNLSSHCNLRAQPRDVQCRVRHTTHPPGQSSVLSWVSADSTHTPSYHAACRPSGRMCWPSATEAMSRGERCFLKVKGMHVIPSW